MQCKVPDEKEEEEHEDEAVQRPTPVDPPIQVPLLAIGSLWKVPIAVVPVDVCSYVSDPTPSFDRMFREHMDTATLGVASHRVSEPTFE